MGDFASALLCVILPVLAGIGVGWVLLYDGDERRRMTDALRRRVYRK